MAIVNRMATENLVYTNFNMLSEEINNKKYEEWELINSITVEEICQGLTIDQDLNGNSFELKKAFIIVKRVLSEEETGYTGVMPLVLNNNDNTSFVISKQTATSNITNISQTYLESSEATGTIMVNNVSSYNDTSIPFNLTYKTDFNFVRGGRLENVKSMTSFKLGNGGAVVYTGVGSEFIIYGIRK